MFRMQIFNGFQFNDHFVFYNHVGNIMPYTFTFVKNI